MNLCNLSEIKALLGRHGFHFSKSMGQNFLIDESIPYSIAFSSGADASTAVLEIGPGIGPLTSQLAKRAQSVTAIELDTALLPVLAETMAEFSNVEVISGDVMKLDLKALVSEKFCAEKRMVCANLPYNITTPVITMLLESGLFDAVTVMIQREVAKRICAAPGTSDYGAFSLFCQYHADCEYLFEVPPDCFLPAPKVTSAVVRLVPRMEPPCPVDSEALFFRTVRASFAQRRKKLLNGLAAAFSSELSKADLAQALADCGFDANVRGEQLGIPEFASLSNHLGQMLHP